MISTAEVRPRQSCRNNARISRSRAGLISIWTRPRTHLLLLFAVWCLTTIGLSIPAAAAAMAVSSSQSGGAAESKEKENEKQHPHQFSVLILGGGLSGLAAARHLAAAAGGTAEAVNLTITLLEARPRLGGRVHTVQLKQPQQQQTFESEEETVTTATTIADLGGMYWHGYSPTLQELVRRYGSIALQPQHQHKQDSNGNENDEQQKTKSNPFFQITPSGGTSATPGLKYVRRLYYDDYQDDDWCHETTTTKQQSVLKSGNLNNNNNSVGNCTSPSSASCDAVKKQQQWRAVPSDADVQEALHGLVQKLFLHWNQSMYQYYCDYNNKNSAHTDPPTDNINPPTEICNNDDDGNIKQEETEIITNASFSKTAATATYGTAEDIQTRPDSGGRVCESFHHYGATTPSNPLNQAVVQWSQSILDDIGRNGYKNRHSSSSSSTITNHDDDDETMRHRFPLLRNPTFQRRLLEDFLYDSFELDTGLSLESVSVPMLFGNFEWKEYSVSSLPSPPILQQPEIAERTVSSIPTTTTTSATFDTVTTTTSTEEEDDDEDEEEVMRKEGDWISVPGMSPLVEALRNDIMTLSSGGGDDRAGAIATIHMNQRVRQIQYDSGSNSIRNKNNDGGEVASESYGGLKNETTIKTTKVERFPSSSCRVTTQSGDHFEAHVCIITLPQGVLKKYGVVGNQQKQDGSGGYAGGGAADPAAAAVDGDIPIEQRCSVKDTLTGIDPTSINTTGEIESSTSSASSSSLFDPPLPLDKQDVLYRSGTSIYNTLVVIWKKPVCQNIRRSSLPVPFAPENDDYSDGNHSKGGVDDDSFVSAVYLLGGDKSAAAGGGGEEEGGSNEKFDSSSDPPLRGGFVCSGMLRHNNPYLTQFYMGGEYDHNGNPYNFDESSEESARFWKQKAWEVVRAAIVDDGNDLSEQQSSSTAQQSTQEMLLTVDDILDWRVSRWHLDRDALGSYSAPVATSRGNADRVILAKPVENVLFFAGEHTNTEGRYQSMDGAYDTGVRAAEEVLSLLKSFR